MWMFLDGFGVLDAIINLLRSFYHPQINLKLFIFAVFSTIKVDDTPMLGFRFLFLFYSIAVSVTVPVTGQTQATGHTEGSKLKTGQYSRANLQISDSFSSHFIS